MNDAEVLGAVAAQADWMEELLVDLVEAPTVLGQEESGQAVIERAWRDCGLEPRSVPLDAERIRAAEGASPFAWSVEGKRNVVADWGSGNGRSLILNGHIDVVPPAAESLWSRPPYQAVRDGDWLYGRGSCDMKSGLAAIAGAVRGLIHAGATPAAPVQLQSVVEEECTGHGALQCVLDGLDADACVIAEPHPDHMTLAQVGVLWFHVTVSGRPEHAARATQGFNAIEAMYPVIAALRELEARLNEDPPPPFDAFEHPINLNPGVIAGGDWPSTVAATCTLSCRIGLFPGMDPAQMMRLVEETLAPTQAQVSYDGFACEGSVVGADEPVVTVLGDAYARLHGDRPALRATTATTDARHFVRAGIPAVCFGPRGERMHGIDERVSLRSVTESAQVLALFIRDWCGLA